jgi:hypothetical protein
MKDIFDLFTKLLNLLRVNRQIKRSLQIISILLLIGIIIFFFVKNNFFDKSKSKDVVLHSEISTQYSGENTFNIDTSQNTVLNTGNNNTISINNINQEATSNGSNIIEIIEEYLENPDIFYTYSLINKEGYNPYYIVAYSENDSISFESFKLKNDRVSIINSLESRDLEFNVSSWKFKPILNNEYLLFSGCMAHSCNTDFGIYVYSLKYDEGYALRTDTSSGYKTIKLPNRLNVFCDFEKIAISDRKQLLYDYRDNKSIYDFLPSRRLPDIKDSIDILDIITAKIKKAIDDTITHIGLSSQLKVYSIYHENFQSNKRGWLVASAFDDIRKYDYVIFSFFDDELNLLSSFRSSYIFGDAGDVYIIKDKIKDSYYSNYIMLAKDCGGTSGFQDIWLYDIKNEIVKINDKKIIRKWLDNFLIERYTIR